MPDRLSATFAALADPTRRAILARLALGDTTVGDLAAPFSMSLPAVSKHLKVLESAGLVARSRDAQWRPCTLSAAPLREVADWVEPYRDFWRSSFDSLAAHLATMQEGSAPKIRVQKTRAPKSDVRKAPIRKAAAGGSAAGKSVARKAAAKKTPTNVEEKRHVRKR